MSSAAERTAARPVHITEVSPASGADSQPATESTLRVGVHRGLVPSHADASTQYPTEPVRTPVAGLTTSVVLTYERQQPEQRTIASVGGDGAVHGADGDQPVIRIFDDMLRESGDPPRPPGNEGKETGFSDPDPLSGPRHALTTFLGDAGHRSIKSRGLAEHILKKEVTARERLLALQKIPPDASPELRDANDRLVPLRSANQDQATEEGSRDIYIATMTIGTAALQLYLRALPDTASETSNVPVGKAKFIRDLVREITAARAAQFDVQRVMEIAADETDAQKPFQEVGKRGKEARKVDNRTLYRNAEAVVRQHAAAVEKAPVIVDTDAKPRGLKSIKETGTLSFGPVEVNHTGQSVKYTGVTIETTTIHPYGKQPTAEVIPDPASESALRITSIIITTEDNHTLRYKVSKTSASGELDFVVEPVHDEDVSSRRIMHLFPDFPGSERRKLNDVLTALAKIETATDSSTSIAEPIIEDSKQSDHFMVSRLALEELIEEDNIDTQTLEAMLRWARLMQTGYLLTLYDDTPELLDKIQQQRQEAKREIPYNDPVYEKAFQYVFTLMQSYKLDANASFGRRLQVGVVLGENLPEFPMIEAAVEGSKFLQQHLREIIDNRNQESYKTQ